jgi:hypothetical protein
MTPFYTHKDLGFVFSSEDKPKVYRSVFGIEPTTMIQCHSLLTVGHCFVRVLVASVSNAFRKPQEMLNAHRLNYSGRERTDSYAVPTCTVESDQRSQ